MTKRLSTKNAIACATSSTRPGRASGAERLAASNIPAGLSAHHGLSMTPGETALTRSGASSLARVLARLSSAPLIAAKPEVPGPALRDEAAVTKVIDPPSPDMGQSGLRGVPMHPEFALEAAAQRPLLHLGERPRSAAG